MKNNIQLSVPKGKKTAAYHQDFLSSKYKYKYKYKYKTLNKKGNQPFHQSTAPYFVIHLGMMVDRTWMSNIYFLRQLNICFEHISWDIEWWWTWKSNIYFLKQHNILFEHISWDIELGRALFYISLSSGLWNWYKYPMSNNWDRLVGWLTRTGMTNIILRPYDICDISFF